MGVRRDGDAPMGPETKARAGATGGDGTVGSVRDEVKMRAAKAAVRGAVAGFSTEDLELMYDMFLQANNHRALQLKELEAEMTRYEDAISRIQGQQAQVEADIRRTQQLIDYLEDAGIGGDD